MGVEEFPQIDGAFCSWVEMGISLEIFGGPSVRTRDFASADFSDKLEPGKVRGTGATIIGRTMGTYDADASISMYLASYIAFQRALRAIAISRYGGAIGAVPFDVPIAWTPYGLGEVFNVKLVGARIAGRGLKAAPGPDAVVVEIPLSIVRLEMDGAALI